MRLYELIPLILTIPLTVACSKEMSREDALEILKNNKVETAVEKLGDTCEVHTVTEVKKATGVFAEGGSQYDRVKNYITEEKITTENTNKYFVTSAKISGYNSSSYKYLKVSFKKFGSNGLTINVSQSDERDNAGIIVKMKQSIYDAINDYGVLTEETTNFYFSYSGEQEGEFEYYSSIKVSFPNTAK